MATGASSFVESRPNGAKCVAEAPRITPGWEDGHRLRHHVQNPFLNRLLARFFPDQRKYPRFFAPPIVAYVGNVGSSKAIPIVNVSVGGFCLRADEFWTPGTVMPITLQRWNRIPQDDPESITLRAMLVRRDGDAAGFAIAVGAEESLVLPGARVQQECNLQAQMENFLRSLPEPPAKGEVVSTHTAATARIISKLEKMELLMEKAKNHKLSTESGAWRGEADQDQVKAIKNPW